MNTTNQRCYYVYILSSLSGTLYVGVTNDLNRRVTEHKSGLVEGFTKKYGVNRLMYYEVFRDAANAAAREQQIKKFRREKKVQLFALSNPKMEGPKQEHSRIPQRFFAIKARY